MNWDAIQAFAETLSAIAVLITLIYLASQIRQNTRALKGTTLNAITVQTGEELRWASEQMELMLKARESIENLSDVEKGRLSTWLSSALHARENEFFQYKLGLLDEDVWQSRLKIIAAMFESESTVILWKTNAHVFSGEFCILVEEIISKRDA